MNIFLYDILTGIHRRTPSLPLASPVQFAPTATPQRQSRSFIPDPLASWKTTRRPCAATRLRCHRTRRPCAAVREVPAPQQLRRPVPSGCAAATSPGLRTTVADTSHPRSRATHHRRRQHPPHQSWSRRRLPSASMQHAGAGGVAGQRREGAGPWPEAAA